MQFSADVASVPSGTRFIGSGLYQVRNSCCLTGNYPIKSVGDGWEIRVSLNIIKKNRINASFATESFNE